MARSVLAGAPLSALQPDTRMAIRSSVNPFDQATVFSIYPQEIIENKRTIYPDIYRIPAGSPKNPARLVVGSASWWRDVDPEQPLLEIPVSAVIVAESIIKDYQNSRVGSNMGDCLPGVFYLPGDVSFKELIEKYPKELEKAIIKQNAWFNVLVKLGDALWARTNGNPLAIPDDMRLACKELGLNRDWVQNFARIEMVPCIACGQLRNPNYPICQSCHAVVDKAKAEELGLVFAK